MSRRFGSMRLLRALLVVVPGCVILLISARCGSEDEPAGGVAGRVGAPEARASRPGADGPAASFVVGDYPGDAAGEDKVTGTPTPDGVIYATTASAYGYESDIVVRVTVLAPPDQPVPEDARIASMEVLASYETPGWADGISEVREGEDRPWFQEQFTGKVLADLVVDPLDPEAGIAAVTGATITSEGATEAARKALQRIVDKTQEAYGAGEQ